MSNRYKPHVLVLPEDEADEQLANGFKISLSINNRALIIDKPAGGWLNVIKVYTGQLVPDMMKYQSCHVVLLIDFDCKAKGATPEKRLEQVRKSIPETLRDRTFILGTLVEPENLRIKLKLNLEKIGEALAENCPDNMHPYWNDELLRHNASELKRLIETARSFLFSK
jgi:hypothetical protein